MSVFAPDMQSDAGSLALIALGNNEVVLSSLLHPLQYLSTVGQTNKQILHTTYTANCKFEQNE